MRLKSLSAVLDEDLENVLARMGLLDEFVKGRVTCSECNSAVGVTNLQYILPLREGRTRFVCDSAECVEAFCSRTEPQE